MTKLGSSGIAYQDGTAVWKPKRLTAWPCACESTIVEVDIECAVMNTATIDSPIATSYEIICDAARMPPSSGQVEWGAQPASTSPYTPIDEDASTTSTDTGTSATWRTVWWPKTLRSGPNGITEKDRNATPPEMTGAMKYTALSASRGMISSLNGSLRPSARLCNQPPGPLRFGPGRTCMRPISFRSNMIANSVSSSRSTNAASTLAS